MDKWISVEDRLPEDGKQVLIIIKPYYIELGNYADNEWLFHGEHIKNLITHWFPFPDIPKK